MRWERRWARHEVAGPVESSRVRSELRRSASSRNRCVCRSIIARRSAWSLRNCLCPCRRVAHRSTPARPRTTSKTTSNATTSPPQRGKVSPAPPSAAARSPRRSLRAPGRTAAPPVRRRPTASPVAPPSPATARTTRAVGRRRGAGSEPPPGEAQAIEAAQADDCRQPKKPDSAAGRCHEERAEDDLGPGHARPPRVYLTRCNQTEQTLATCSIGAGRAVLRQVGQQVPVRVVEVDDIDRRDAGRVERDVVVLDGEPAQLAPGTRRTSARRRCPRLPWTACPP